MAWAGGTFNRANGPTGWQDDQAANIGIEASRHDTQDNDFRDGINACLNKAGQNTPTANLPMGGFRHTGAGDAVGDADYATYGQVKAGVNISKAGAIDYSVSQYSANVNGPVLSLQKARGGSVGTNTIVNNGDSLGTIVFRGANGTTFTDGAWIAASISGSPGAANDMPTRLAFYTTSDASGTPTVRYYIESDGSNTFSNGSVKILSTAIASGAGTHALRYNTTGGILTYDTSSLRYKDNVTDCSYGLDAVLALQPRQFTYKSDGKADVGFIAEEMVQVVPEVVSNNTEGQPDAISYDRLVAVLCKAIQELEERVAALEAGA